MAERIAAGAVAVAVDRMADAIGDGVVDGQAVGAVAEGAVLDEEADGRARAVRGDVQRVDHVVRGVEEAVASRFAQVEGVEPVARVDVHDVGHPVAVGVGDGGGVEFDHAPSCRVVDLVLPGAQGVHDGPLAAGPGGVVGLAGVPVGVGDRITVSPLPVAFGGSVGEADPGAVRAEPFGDESLLGGAVDGDQVAAESLGVEFGVGPVVGGVGERVEVAVVEGDERVLAVDGRGVEVLGEGEGEGVDHLVGRGTVGRQADDSLDLGRNRIGDEDVEQVLRQDSGAGIGGDLRVVEPMIRHDGLEAVVVRVGVDDRDPRPVEQLNGRIEGARARVGQRQLDGVARVDLAPPERVLVGVAALRCHERAGHGRAQLAAVGVHVQQVGLGGPVVVVLAVALELNAAGPVDAQVVGAAHGGTPLLAHDGVVGAAGGDGDAAHERAGARAGAAVVAERSVGGIAQFNVGIEPAVGGGVDTDGDDVSGESLEAPVVGVGPVGAIGGGVHGAQSPSHEVAAEGGVLEHLEWRGVFDGVVAGVFDDHAAGRVDGEGVDVVIAAGAIAITVERLGIAVDECRREGRALIVARGQWPGCQRQRDLRAAGVGGVDADAVEDIVVGVERVVLAGAAKLPACRCVHAARLEFLARLDAQRVDGGAQRAAVGRQRPDAEQRGRSGVQQEPRLERLDQGHVSAAARVLHGDSLSMWGAGAREERRACMRRDTGAWYGGRHLSRVAIRSIDIWVARRRAWAVRHAAHGARAASCGAYPTLGVCRRRVRGRMTIPSSERLQV